MTAPLSASDQAFADALRPSPVRRLPTQSEHDRRAARAKVIARHLCLDAGYNPDRRMTPTDEEPAWFEFFYPALLLADAEMIEADRRRAAELRAMVRRDYAQHGEPLPAFRDDGITIPAPPRTWAGQRDLMA